MYEFQNVDGKVYDSIVVWCGEMEAYFISLFVLLDVDNMATESLCYGIFGLSNIFFMIYIYIINNVMYLEFYNNVKQCC